MVLSTVKMERKEAENAAAVAVLNLPPGSTVASSLGKDVKGDSPAVLSAKRRRNGQGRRPLMEM